MAGLLKNPYSSRKVFPKGSLSKQWKITVVLKRGVLSPYHSETKPLVINCPTIRLKISNIQKKEGYGGQATTDVKHPGCVLPVVFQHPSIAAFYLQIFLRDKLKPIS